MWKCPVSLVSPHNESCKAPALLLLWTLPKGNSMLNVWRAKLRRGPYISPRLYSNSTRNKTKESPRILLIACPHQVNRAIYFHLADRQHRQPKRPIEDLVDFLWQVSRGTPIIGPIFLCAPCPILWVPFSEKWEVKLVSWTRFHHSSQQVEH